MVPPLIIEATLITSKGNNECIPSSHDFDNDISEDSLSNHAARISAPRSHVRLHAWMHTTATLYELAPL